MQKLQDIYHKYLIHFVEITKAFDAVYTILS